MSIWCSTKTIGFDRWVEWSKRPTGGTVRKYASGWSNHYPTNDEEGPAMIDFATLPIYCVPGHEDSTDYERCGPWLRMGLVGEGVDHWTKKVETEQATVVMNVAAVKALRDYLDEWLARPKARPKTTTPPHPVKGEGASVSQGSDDE